MCYKNLILFGANCFLDKLTKGSLLVWHKRNSEGFLANAEAAWMNKGLGVHIYSEPVEKMQAERTHPTQKPVGLMKWCINKAGEPKTILDPFAGSCTTGRASKDLNRKCICIELEEKYCEIGAKRMAQEVMQF